MSKFEKAQFLENGQKRLANILSEANPTQTGTFQQKILGRGATTIRPAVALEFGDSVVRETIS